MIAVRRVRLIEQHSDELTEALLGKFQASARTSDLKKVPEHELRARSHEILCNLSDWLLSKSDLDVGRRYREIGSLRASQNDSRRMSAGESWPPKIRSRAFCNVKAFCAVRSRSLARWNYFDYWTNFSIAPSATASKATKKPNSKSRRPHPHTAVAHRPQVLLRACLRNPRILGTSAVNCPLRFVQNLRDGSR